MFGLKPDVPTCFVGVDGPEDELGIPLPVADWITGYPQS
jgi:hypothetical protein